MCVWSPDDLDSKEARGWGMKELRVFPGCRIQLSYLVTQSVLSTVTVPSLVTVDRTDCVTECTLLLPVLVLVLDVEDEYPEKYTPSSCTSRDIHHPHPQLSSRILKCFICI